MNRRGRWLIALCLLPWAWCSSAAILRQTLLATDSPFSVQSQHACTTYLQQPSPHWCNPALFSFAKASPIKADFAMSSDHDAYELSHGFLAEPLTKEMAERLFKEKNFQSFSALMRLEAMSQHLSLAYVPAYVVGAYQLYNPNLPELLAAGVRESQLRLTSGGRMARMQGWEIYGGASLNLFERRLYEVHANALDLVVEEMPDLVSKDRQRGLNADIGFFAKTPSDHGPGFSLVVENMFRQQSHALGEERILDLYPIFRRRLRLGAGHTLVHATGSYHVGLQLPFWDFGSRLDRDGISSSLIYGIGWLRTFVSYSPLMSAFGFVFMGPYYHVGIQYTNDKQDNSLDLGRQKHVYLFGSFNF